MEQRIADLEKENKKLCKEITTFSEERMIAVPIGKPVEIPRKVQRDKDRFIRRKGNRLAQLLTDEMKKVAAQCALLVSQEMRTRELEKQLEEIYTCFICEERYNDTVRAPTLLVCGHTLCQQCVQKLHHDTSVRCPYCKHLTLVGLLHLLPKNYAIIPRGAKP